MGWNTSSAYHHGVDLHGALLTQRMARSGLVLLVGLASSIYHRMWLQMASMLSIGAATVGRLP